MSQSQVMISHPSGVDYAPPSDFPPRCHLLSSSESRFSHSRLSRGVAVFPCPTRHPGERCQTLSVPRADPSASSTSNSMSLTPSPESVRAVISHALPNVGVESIRQLVSNRLQTIFGVKISDGRTLLLILPPSLMLRLLRSEKWLVLSEALVIKWISGKLTEHTTRDARLAIQRLLETRPKDSILSREANNNLVSMTPTAWKQVLLHYLPTIMADSPSSGELGSAFNLLEATVGTPVSSLQIYPTASERETIDFQKGQLIRLISNFKAPNGRFGPAVAVIGPSSKKHGATPTIVGSGGVETWTKAFLSLVEGILRDGEDMAVMMSYSLIRGHVRRLGHLLDAVTESRLVVLDAGNDANVLVSRSTKPSNIYETRESSPTQVSSAAGTPQALPDFQDAPRHRHKRGIGHEYLGESDEDSSSSSSEDEDHHQEYAATVESCIAVTGLRDWSNAIFGDPLMTSVFSQDPSPDFLQGFQQQQKPPAYPSDRLPAALAEKTSASDGSEGPDDGLIEDRENAHIRLLLYECYHATVCIVKQFYRPSTDSTKREMAARRRLAAVLNKLDHVDETAGKRPRRASSVVEGWPSKKIKGG